jgi:hypothetical protein
VLQGPKEIAEVGTVRSGSTCITPKTGVVRRPSRPCQLTSAITPSWSQPSLRARIKAVISLNVDQPLLNLDLLARLVTVLVELDDIYDSMMNGACGLEEKAEKIVRELVSSLPKPIFDEVFALYPQSDVPSKFGLLGFEWSVGWEGGLGDILYPLVFRFPEDAKVALLGSLQDRGLESLILWGFEALSRTPVWPDDQEKLEISKTFLSRPSVAGRDNILGVLGIVNSCSPSAERADIVTKVKALYQARNPGVGEKLFADALTK